MELFIVIKEEHQLRRCSDFTLRRVGSQTRLGGRSLGILSRRNHFIFDRHNYIAHTLCKHSWNRNQRQDGQSKQVIKADKYKILRQETSEEESKDIAPKSKYN